MRSPSHPTGRSKPTRQLAISLDRPVLIEMTPADRNTAIRRLGRLLMEAAGAFKICRLDHCFSADPPSCQSTGPLRLEHH
jgi:hypothetical protein